MATSLLFIDSAWPTPPSQIPSGVVGVAGYIGGDTPHIWTKAEWDGQRARYRLPIYVRSNPPGPGANADVAGCLSMLGTIGAPKGTLVAWDMETAVDPAYLHQVYDLLNAAGYKLIVYASQSVVFEQGNPDGLYWGAEWTGAPHIHVNDAITQYVSFHNFDLSEASSVLPFWDTQPNVTPPPPPVAWVDFHYELPQISPGDTDNLFPHWYVRRVQAVLNAVWHYRLTIDGIYGPASQSAVKNVQDLNKLTKDGIVGVQTWAVLLAGKSPGS